RERALRRGGRLRRARLAALEGKATEVRGAADAPRRAVAAAVAEAERLGGAAGSNPATDALMRTFEALSLAAEPPQPPGRLTEALQPAGFEALAGVTPKPQPKPSHAGRDRQAEGVTAPDRPAALVHMETPPERQRHR